MTRLADRRLAARRRLERQLDAAAVRLPWLRRPLAAIRSRGAVLVRLPVAVLLILGGLLSVLPFLGLWMLPLGLILLALDIPALRGPVGAAIVRLRRRLSRRRAT